MERQLTALEQNVRRAATLYALAARQHCRRAETEDKDGQDDIFHSLRVRWHIGDAREEIAKINALTRHFDLHRIYRHALARLSATYDRIQEARKEQKP